MPGARNSSSHMGRCTPDPHAIPCGPDVPDSQHFTEFLEKISTMPIPAIIRDANKQLLEETKALAEETEKEEVVSDKKENEPELKKNIIDAALDSYVNGMTAMQLFFRKAGTDAMDFAGDFFRDKNTIARQQMFYGVLKLYNGDLENFMQG